MALSSSSSTSSLVAAACASACATRSDIRSPAAVGGVVSAKTSRSYYKIVTKQLLPPLSLISPRHYYYKRLGGHVQGGRTKYNYHHRQHITRAAASSSSGEEAAMTSTKTTTTTIEKAGVKIIKNPPESKLTDLGVRSWPKWGCPPSKFPWTYSAKETCYLLKGKVKVYPDGTDEVVEIGAGDFVEFPKGMSCTWDVSEEVDKHYNFE